MRIEVSVDCTNTRLVRKPFHRVLWTVTLSSPTLGLVQSTDMYRGTYRGYLAAVVFYATDLNPLYSVANPHNFIRASPFAEEKITSVYYFYSR